MSYDLEVRPDANYSKSVSLEKAASIVSGFAGVVRTGPRSFTLDRSPSGIQLTIDLGYELGTEEEAISDHHQVNCVALLVPYPFLTKSGAVALEMAVDIAERLGWSVYDPQGDCIVTRDSLPDALQLQRSSGAAADAVLEKAAAEAVSLGELFVQEMWNHGLVAAAMTFVGVAIVLIWAMLDADWPLERIGKYLPFAAAVGGLGGLWLKGFVQAYVRFRRLRNEFQK